MKRVMTEYDFTRQISCWQPGAQPHRWCQNLGAKVLAVGIASALAIFAPLKAETVTQEVSLMNQPLDMNVDGIPDLLCMASEDTDTDNWTNTNYLYCRAFGGARIWSNAEACLPVTTKVSQTATPSNGGSWQAVCQLGVSVDDGNALPETGSSAGPSTKTLTLGIMTSAKEYSTLNVVVNSTNTEVKTVSWTYDGPITNLAAVVDNDQIGLSWENKSDSGTGAIEIYRNDQLVATLLDNAIFYTDDKLPQRCDVTYTYVVKVVNASGGVSQPATVSIKPSCTPPDPPPPLSRVFIKVDGQCAGRVTTTPDVGIDCATSDCQQVKTPTGEMELNCKPAQCSAGLKNVGETISLIARPESAGCEFSSWGERLLDCADGELTVTADNKMCVAYFNFKVKDGRDGKKDSLRSVFLPNLGPGQAFCHHGEEEKTSALFSGGVSVNGSGSYQQTATVKAFVDQIDIQGKIKVDSQHLSSLTSDVFVYLSYQATVQDAPTFWMVDEQNKFWSWDGKPASLVPFQTGVSLTANDELTVNIYQGTMQDTGIVKIFFGYRLGNGTVVCNFAGPLELNVRDK